jgi:HlyD family secretion protein
VKRFLSWLLVVAILAGFAGTFYYLWNKSKEVPVVYKTESPLVADIVKKAVATGSVVPRKEVAIKPQISGIVEQLNVEAGQMVKQGEVLARIRVVPNMGAESAAENRLKTAQISLANAQIDFDRNRNLNEQGILAKSSYQQFEKALELAQQEVAAATDNLQIVREGSSKRLASSATTQVRATVSGMVLEVPIEVGNSVIEANTFNDGTTIATVADMAEMIFEGRVDESEVGKLKLGMELLLTVAAIDQERFTAKLEHIAPKGVEQDGAIQFEIRAAISLAQGFFLRANYSANADIVLDKRTQVLAISESLLQFDDKQQPYVEVETGPQQFTRKDVKVGLSDGITIEILEGIAAGDKIKNPNTAST